MTGLLRLRECRLRVQRKFCWLRGDSRGVKRFSNLIAGNRAWTAVEKSFDDAVQPTLSVEIGTDCNYQCSFCPQSSFRRPSHFMSGDDFDLLMHRLEDIQYEGHVCLAVNNEPFLHPKLLDFCAAISRRLPKGRGALISNGALIKLSDLKTLAQLDVPPGIEVNDYTESRVVATRLRGWLETNPDLKRIPLSITLRGSTEMLSNRAGNQPVGQSFIEDYQDVFCTWPFMSLFFTWELKAFLCCSDYRHAVILGDLHQDGIMKIWQGSAYREIRARMLETARAGLPLCRNCDAEWFQLPEHCA